MPFRGPSQQAVTPQGAGRFPGYDVLSQSDHWDAVTAGVVLSRLAPAGDLAFFTPAEEAAARALVDLLLAQDREPRIPVTRLIDARLAAGETDGWHYEDMPADPQAWRETLARLDDDAGSAHGASFADAGAGAQARLLNTIARRATEGGEWHGWSADHVWNLWTRYACAAFYCHPWAWNEIGFGGPAYPRGYKALAPGGPGGRERWESADSDDRDPVAYAERVRQAHNRHGDVVGESPEGRPSR